MMVIGTVPMVSMDVSLFHGPSRQEKCVLQSICHLFGRFGRLYERSGDPRAASVLAGPGPALEFGLVLLVVADPVGQEDAQFFQICHDCRDLIF